MILVEVSNGRQIELEIPDQLIDAIAERVADVILSRFADGFSPAGSRHWMRSDEAAEYLGWSRSAVYGRVSRNGMPHYKVDGMLLFKGDELDAWLEQYREAPRERDPLYAPPLPPSHRKQARKASSSSASSSLGRRPEQASESKPIKRERPLPPPLCGDESQKDRWARELEITRAELDEMSPRDFKKAWDGRSKRLEDGGVFLHLDELETAYGWKAIEKMAPSELIRAVADLDLTPATVAGDAVSEPLAEVDV